MVDWKRFWKQVDTAAADTTSGNTLSSGDSQSFTYTTTIGTDWTTTTDNTSGFIPDTPFGDNITVSIDGSPPTVLKEKTKTEIKEVIIPEQEPLSWTPQKGKLLALIHKDDVEDLDGTRLYKGPVTRMQTGGLVNFSFAIGTSSDPLGRTISRGMALLKEFALGGLTLHNHRLEGTEKWLDAEGQIYHRRTQTVARNADGTPVSGGEVILIENDDALFFSSKLMTELAKEGFGVLEVETPVEEADFYATYGEEIVQYVDPIIIELREPWGGWGDEE